MAQLPSMQQLSSALGGGFDPTLPAVRDWAAVAFDRVRRSILPHHDEPPRIGASSADTSPALHPVARRLVALAPTVMLAATVVLLALAVALFAFRAMYDNRIYPAVVVGDVNVGGLTAAAAEERLTERANALEEGTIAFSYNGQEWMPTLSELGATVDLDTSIAEAERLGRGGDAASRLSFATDILQADQVVPLRTRIDQQALNAWFDRVDRDIANPAINAQIVVSGSKVSVSPDATGIIVDREAATGFILAALSSLQPVDTALPTMVDVPEILASELVPVQSDVQALIASPIRVEFENQTWRIDGTTLSTYLLVETVTENGRPTAQLSMDTDRLAKDLRAQFVSEINREPVNARVGWSNENGLIALDPSETGVTIKTAAFADAVANGFLNGDKRVEIPVVVTRPDIDDENLDALGITELLGRGDSNYAGGARGRDTNVEVGVSYLNGTLVPPGGTFSFNSAVGAITYEKGYQEAEVVVGEQIGRDVGGGICQVSTTVFRAALLAGMPIAEWHQHSYRLLNYERDGWSAGFDASILQNSWQSPEEWPDFKFENYTDGWLLVESWTSYPNVIVNIYGTSDGREVDLNAWGIDGKDAGFTRVIYDAEGNVIAERSFASTFR